MEHDSNLTFDKTLTTRPRQEMELPLVLPKSTDPQCFSQDRRAYNGG
jgi:hypothetical protein